MITKKQNEGGDIRPLKVAAYCRVATDKQLNDTTPDHRKIKIKDYYGEEITINPQFIRYSVTDFMGRKMTIPGISLTVDTSEGEEPFAVLTKSFGEFIGMKDCAYIDTNNCAFANIFVDLGIAQPTGFTKESGFCSYPLWKFDEGFLKQIGDMEYEQYSEAFDEYMGNTTRKKNRKWNRKTRVFPLTIRCNAIIKIKDLVLYSACVLKVRQFNSLFRKSKNIFFIVA